MAMISVRTPWRRKLRWDHLVATSATIVLHLAAGWFLLEETGSSESAAEGRDQVIEISFIERVPASVPRNPPVLRPRSALQRHATARISKSGATEPQSAEDLSGGRDMVSAAGQLNLSLPDAPMSFERNPVARPAVPIPEAPLRMPLTFTDRSFGGLMQRMTSASVCRELRMSLTASPESAATIIASMQRIGCKS